jgi:hypothetical protein
MTRGEAINDRARKGNALAQAELHWACTTPRDPKGRYAAGVALANAHYAYEEAQRVERSLKP